MFSYTNSIAESIVDFVKENPGATRNEILTALPEGIKWGTVSNTLSRMARSGVLENRGGSTNRWDPARWFFIARPVNDYAREQAREILADLAKLHPSVREQFLAEKLDEMFEETPCKENHA
jgi:hypothetical protein